MIMGIEKFLRRYDWVARADLAFGWIFDWRNWLWSLVPAGGGMTFLWSAIENRAPLDVWIDAVVVMAGLAIIVYVLIWLLGKIRGRKSSASSVQTAAPSLMADHQTGKWVPLYPH